MAQTETASQAGPAVGSGLGATDRTDNWWIGPLAVGLGFGAFIIYSTGRAIAGCFTDTYFYGLDTKHLFETHAHVISPFFSPRFLLPAPLDWVSPAFFILWAPGGFRLTCYYYRKAYYRAFFFDPPGCAVGEPSSLCGVKRELAYKGETKLLLFQNLHRYFMYVALIFIGILSYDVILACIWPDGQGGHKFGVSVGTLVLAATTTLLALYTFSCHSLRHLIGGRINCFSRVAFGESRYKAWSVISKLNEHHMFWAWVSLFMVGFADFYVWMVASGRWEDYIII